MNTLVKFVRNAPLSVTEHRKKTFNLGKKVKRMLKQCDVSDDSVEKGTNTIQ